MPVNWSYVAPTVVSADIPQQIKDEWEATLLAERDRIYESLTSKISNSTQYQDRVADASSDQYEVFLSAVGSGYDKDTILAKQRIKLAASYTSWNDGIVNAFRDSGQVPAGNDVFRTNVTAKKAKISNLRRVLAVVGDKPRTFWGAGSKAVLFANGDTRPSRYVIAGETLVGTPHNVFHANFGRQPRATLLGELARGVILAKYADEAGLTTLRDALITTYNARLATMVDAMLDATHAGVGYTVVLTIVKNGGTGNIDVSIVDTHA